jgi:5-methylcytosine-specific restriction endonuclease McrA
MKTIVIKDKHSIDKLTHTKSLREVCKTWNIEDKTYEWREQINAINLIYMNYDTNINNETHYVKSSLKNSNNNNIFIREISKKIQGYKNQDNKKKCFDKTHFVSLEDTIEMLVKSKLKCVYCNNSVYILYKHIRDDSQWTLDRIDNDQGHNINNCVICCLKCNLQRRTTDDKKFKFTKQMKLIKKN